MKSSTLKYGQLQQFYVNALHSKSIVSNLGSPLRLTFAVRQSRDECVSAQDFDAIEATKNGDPQAFSDLVERYHDAIVIQMRRFSTDCAVLEELVHDVFVEAYLSINSFRHASPLLHWLRKIAVRVGYRYWKNKNRDRQLASLSSLGDTVREMESNDSDVESEPSDLMNRMLQRMSPRDRLVLTLIYLEGQSTVETAKLTGWSVAMVKVQAHRARRKLRILVEEARTNES